MKKLSVIKKLVVVVSLFAFIGCSSKAQNINASYVSPLQYQNYNCSQISDEIARVNRKVIEVSGQQDSTANKDAVAMTVGLVLFWPALFFIPGGEHKDELARLKGEYDALESIAVAKECKTVLAEIENSKKQQAIQKAKEEKETKERMEANNSH